MNEHIIVALQDVIVASVKRPPADSLDFTSKVEIAISAVEEHFILVEAHGQPRDHRRFQSIRAFLHVDYAMRRFASRLTASRWLPPIRW